MNRSHSPVLRPLSNISNKTLSSNNLQTKQNENFSKSFDPNLVIFPQQLSNVKSANQEVKTLEKKLETPKSSFTFSNSSQRLSSNSEDDRNKPSASKQELTSKKETKFLQFKILVFMAIIAFAVLLFQIQTYIFYSSDSAKINDELIQAKEKIIADSISNSIVQTVVYECKKINLDRERNDVESFYQDEFSSNLWKLVLENVSRDIRIKVETLDNEEFWTI